MDSQSLLTNPIEPVIIIIIIINTGLSVRNIIDRVNTLKVNIIYRHRDKKVVI